MLYIQLKNNLIEDVKIVEKYNNKVIFELTNKKKEKKIKIEKSKYEYKYKYKKEYEYKRDYTNFYTIKFIFINGTIWYKINQDTDIIKRCIAKECSFLMTGIYESKEKYQKIINLLLSLCKKEEVKIELLKEIEKNK